MTDRRGLTGCGSSFRKFTDLVDRKLLAFTRSGRSETEAYLKHPVLGARLKECTRSMFSHPSLTVREFLGSPDDLKFHSSMTLLGIAAQSSSPFKTALHVFYGGEGDQATLAALKNYV